MKISKRIIMLKKDENHGSSNLVKINNVFKIIVNIVLKIREKAINQLDENKKKVRHLIIMLTSLYREKLSNIFI